MKKEIVLPSLALLGGSIGFGVRRWELAAALDPATGLMELGCPATWLLLALTAAELAAAVVLCLGADRRKLTPEQRFRAPVTGYILLVVCAALVLLAAAGAGMVEFSRSQQRNPVHLVLYVLCLLGGLSALGAGRSVYRMRWSDSVPVLIMGPAFCALVWLIATYQQQSRQPVLLLYVYQLMAVAAAVLALYGLASLSMGRGSAGRTCVFGLMAIYLSLVTWADGHGLAFDLLYLFVILYLTAQMYLLLRGAFGAPWPERVPGRAEDEDDRDENEGEIREEDPNER